MTRLDQALRWWDGRHDNRRAWEYHQNIPNRHFKVLVKAGWLREGRDETEGLYFLLDPPHPPVEDPTS